ncbi:hypothetical protein IMSAGC020_02769 [Lachnospiraceae bacterium]|jgi:acyl carrier protein|nr:hypothetical protein IMSAGC020_02769 [Lachnospiraceae bacterium]
MDERKKLALLEEMMELDEGELSADMELDSICEFNSMAKLGLVVLMNDEFSKHLTNDQIKAFSTVQDILDYME